ncbi:MAG: helix-turn-helix transcriptional regulator [Steroidobacteraceae bacterium]
MKLKKYLKDHSITQEEFGRRIGVKRLAVSRYLNGTRKPSSRTAMLIVKVTKRLVTLEDLYE